MAQKLWKPTTLFSHTKKKTKFSSVIIQQHKCVTCLPPLETFVASFNAHNHQITKMFCRIYFLFWKGNTFLVFLLQADRILILHTLHIHISTDHTSLTTKTVPVMETMENSLCCIRTNWAALSCDNKIKLDSQNVFSWWFLPVKFWFPVKLLIMCVPEHLLTQCFVMFVCADRKPAHIPARW